MMMRRATTAGVLLVMLSACSFAQTSSPPQPAFQRPTASRIFRQTTECAELARRAEKHYAERLALPPRIGGEPLYDPAANRCYVKLSWGPAGNAPGTATVLDAHTEDVSVAAHVCRDGTRSGFMWDESNDAAKNITYDAAWDRIREMMGERGKRSTATTPSGTGR
jgi:hypothetical protein